jgi:protein TonB
MQTLPNILLASCLLLVFSSTAFSQDTNFAIIKGDTVFKKVAKESTFKGGINGWTNFLQSTLVYPRKAARKKVEGVVVLQFIVDERGDIHDAEILSGDPLLSGAALDVIRQSPRWTPAELNGEKVKSYKKQPIAFRLQ